ncbi:MAG: hypothetical protein R2879_18280 [Saprospiraceae bacterium]
MRTNTLVYKPINGTDTIWSYLRPEFDWVDEDTSNFCRALQIVVKELAVQQFPNVPFCRRRQSIALPTMTFLLIMKFGCIRILLVEFLYFKPGLKVKNVQVLIWLGGFWGGLGLRMGGWMLGIYYLDTIFEI